MLWLQDQKRPCWSRAMMPDVYRHLAPTPGQKGFPL